MKKQLFHGALAVLSGAVLAMALLWLGAATPARANPDTRYVAPPPAGSDAGNDCTDPGSPCATIQHAIDVANPGDEILVVGGTYTSAIGTVAVITKEVRIIGAFDPAFTAPDPDLYQTVLDAQWGGSVISITNAGDVFLQHLKITHGDGTGSCQSSTVGGCGGGIFAEGADLHIAQCFLTDNVGSSTKGGLGGGIYVNASGHAVEMWQSQVISNTAAVSSSLPTQYGDGGGVYINGGTAALWQNEILDNVGSVNHGGSGGIHLSGVTHAEILTNAIVNNWGNINVTWYSGGGGLYVDDYSKGVLVSGNVIEGNWGGGSAGEGGGVYVWMSDVHLTRNMIMNNVSGPDYGNGGGLYIQSSTPVTLSNNLIAQNSSGSNGGGVYVTMGGVPGSQALLVNNTIADNGDSGVLADRYATVTMTNNLIAGHAAGITTTAPATVSADTNLLWNASDPIVGSNAIQQDPLFTGTYHLRDGSPALDAGLTIPWLTTDLDGTPRPQGSKYDVGAFERKWWALYLPVVMKSYEAVPTLIFSDDFESGALTGWTPNNGAWANPGTYMSGTYKLGNAWNMHTSTGSDVVYTGTVNLLSGNAVGLTFRSSADGTSSYDVILDAVTNVFKISKRPPYQILGSYAMTVQRNHPYTVRVVANGNTIEAYLDGVKHLTVTDSTYSSGQLGVVLFQSTATYDDLQAWELP